MALGPARRAIPCPLCNEKFFPASLPFHQKQCEKRRGQRIVPCPYCQKEVIQLDLPEHIKVCPKGAGRGRGSGGRNDSTTGGSHGRGGGKGRVEPTSMEVPGNANYEPQVLDDGRMSCMFCGRFFNPDRIDKHQQICGKLQSARPKGVDGSSTQAPKKVFNASQARIGHGSAFMSAKQAERKKEQDHQAIRQERNRAAKKNDWRRAHAEFQAACKAGRGENVTMPIPAPKSGITCPYCNRVFSEEAAERHIPICAKVVNKPKPPPSPARSPDPMSRTSRGTSSRGTSSPGPSRGARGPPESPSPPSRTLRRPVSKDRTPRREDAETHHINDTTPPGRDGKRSASCSRLPAVDTPKSAGHGMHAARDLRRQDSDTKLSSTRSSTSEKLLPQLQNSGSGNLNSTSNSTGRKPPTAPRQKALESTTFNGDRCQPCISDDDLDQDSQTANATVMSMPMPRVGLRRCAMMYRLLSAVPEDVLAREVAECGIDGAADMDQEGLIEAIIGQLS